MTNIFLLLLLIPWELNRWRQRLVCRMGRLSDRALELPSLSTTHQSIPYSNTSLCILSSPPNVNQTLSPSVLTHTLLTTTTLFFLAFSLPLFVCHSVAAMIRAATANQTARELPELSFLYLPIKFYCDSQPIL